MPDVDPSELPSDLAASVSEPEVVTDDFADAPPLEQGASLEDAMNALEGGDAPDETPADDAAVGETAPDTEPVAPEPDRGDAETPEPADDDAAPAPSGEEEVPEIDLVAETAKRGWKPPYDPQRLDDPAYAEEWQKANGIPLLEGINRHWRKVYSVTKQEVAEQSKRYEGIDPDDARSAVDFRRDLLEEPKFQYLRDIASESDGKASGNPYASIALALLNTDHPHHVEAVRRWQGTPDPNQATAPRTREDILRAAYDDETGQVDFKKADALMEQRERAIVQATAAQVRKGQSAEAPQEPQPTPNGKPTLVQMFCEANGLDTDAVIPAFQLAAQRAALTEEKIEPSLAGVRRLYEIVQDMRKEALAPSEEARQRQAEVARHKGASTPKPRSATPDSGPPSVSGASLEKVMALEAAGEINPKAEGY